MKNKFNKESNKSWSLNTPLAFLSSSTLSCASVLAESETTSALCLGAGTALAAVSVICAVKDFRRLYVKGCDEKSEPKSGSIKRERISSGNNPSATL